MKLIKLKDKALAEKELNEAFAKLSMQCFGVNIEAIIDVVKTVDGYRIELTNAFWGVAYAKVSKQGVQFFLEDGDEFLLFLMFKKVVRAA